MPQTKIARLLFAAFILIAASLVRPTAALAQQDSPEAAIKSFYGWYVNLMVKGDNPYGKSARKEFERHVTMRYLKALDKQRQGDGFDADPFLNAQDFDKQWAKNIKVSNTSTKGDRATADVEMTGSEMGSTKVRVELQRDGDSWKIDKVDPR
jgi:hypothetical protein